MNFLSTFYILYSSLLLVFWIRTILVDAKWCISLIWFAFLWTLMKLRIIMGALPTCRFLKGTIFPIFAHLKWYYLSKIIACLYIYIYILYTIHTIYIIIVTHIFFIISMISYYFPSHCCFSLFYIIWGMKALFILSNTHLFTA